MMRGKRNQPAGEDQQHQRVERQEAEAQAIDTVRAADIGNMAGDQRQCDGGHGFNEADKPQHEHVMRQRVDLPADDDCLRLQPEHAADPRREKAAEIEVA